MTKRPNMQILREGAVIVRAGESRAEDVPARASTATATPTPRDRQLAALLREARKLRAAH